MLFKKSKNFDTSQLLRPRRYTDTL